MDFPDAVGPDIIAVHGDVNGKEVIVIAWFFYYHSVLEMV